MQITNSQRTENFDLWQASKRIEILIKKDLVNICQKQWSNKKEKKIRFSPSDTNLTETTPMVLWYKLLWYKLWFSVI